MLKMGYGLKIVTLKQFVHILNNILTWASMLAIGNQLLTSLLASIINMV